MTTKIQERIARREARTQALLLEAAKAKNVHTFRRLIAAATEHQRVIWHLKTELNARVKAMLNAQTTCRACRDNVMHTHTGNGIN